MIKEIVAIEMPVHERLVLKKNHLEPAETTGKEKRISIVTGIHGDELDGQYICYEVIRRLQEHPEQLQGIVDVYPAVNPLGLDTGSRGIPMFDLDMNRVFPGDRDGAIAEYAAAGLVDDIIGSDLCIDLHSSNIFVKEAPQVRLTEENADKLLPYARMMNADFVWIYSSVTVLDATLAYSLNNMGVPSLVVEMGVGHRISNAYCRQILDGIFHVMRQMGIWTGEDKPVKDPILSSEGEVSFLKAEESGVFVSAIEHLGRIRQGELIGEVVEPISGTLLQKIIAPVDGVIFTIRENPMVFKGTLLARVSGDAAEKRGDGI